MTRLRPFILITGTLLSVLIAAAFVVSGRWQIMGQLGNVRVFLGAGSVTVSRDDPSIDPFAFGQHKSGLGRWDVLGADRAKDRVEFPLLVPFLAVAVPTLLVWRFGPKPVKPGHCRCGYDLKGNTSGVCPECGREAKRR